MKQLRPYQQEALDKLLKRLKETTHPLLINASVGAGKSLIIAQLLLVLERANMRALCLTLNSTLIQQNAETYQLQGGHCSIYCAALNSKRCEDIIVFASPNSICQGIRNKDKVSSQPFQLIVVDEAHQISPHDNSSMYMRIINHYGAMAQTEQYSFRVVGLTGTPYRGKGYSIVGDDQFFKEEVCDISASWLIENEYLTPPQFGLIKKEYDFSQLRVNQMGKFNQSEIQAVVDKNSRLTDEIMQELTQIMKQHTGGFIFASTRKHCLECAKSLPDGEWAIILGETPHEQRKIILEKARNGDYKYLISVNCLSVGVDVPSFDVCAWLRPTESLVLYTQGIGRILRLSLGKKLCLVLDYAGNLARHGDIDDPIINAALQPKDENAQDYCIPCYTCNTNNTIHARRCIGISDNKRCTHYFEFKDCPNCQTKNDIVSRQCRECETELIDPNAKLKKEIATKFELDVMTVDYSITYHHLSATPIITVKYRTNTSEVYECYFTNTERAKNIFYAKFVRLHLSQGSSEYYMQLQKRDKIEKLIDDSRFRTPSKLICSYDEEKGYVISKKIFQSE